jgi:hypothetical protein
VTPAELPSADASIGMNLADDWRAPFRLPQEPD